ncbi:MAG TPA: HD domain-containing phosphohydrolase [Myxococcaceae bacterium]
MRPDNDSPQDLAGRVSKLTSILDVAKAMAAARDLDLLLPLIIYEAAKVVDADRCTLFILDRERGELWSKVAQGAAHEIRVRLGKGIAGSVADTGQVINITDAYADARFNRDIDAATGYRTRTILCVPMRDAQGEVTGVLQALNKHAGVFTDEDTELLLALGGQAAGAIENALLHDEINRLFEGFVSASVVAIESRDPTTAGHSGRVASLTVGLASALEHQATGSYARVRFGVQDVQEMRYASLLHDFGKVGVREHVLVKAEKLYPQELDVLRARFALARKDRVLESVQRRLAASIAAKLDPGLERVEAERLERELHDLDDTLQFILACNRPTILPSGGFERLADLGRTNFRDERDAEQPLLLQREVERLSIPRGSLSAEERLEIESHVTHTFRFLSQIPWTRALKRVPDIAYAHHERLNGSGYPRKIPAATIPVQSKMMAISDVYDALTAADRPYKKAVPHPAALDILHQEAKSGMLDGELLRIFVEAEVPRRALRPPGA